MNHLLKQVCSHPPLSWWHLLNSEAGQISACRHLQVKKETDLQTDVISMMGEYSFPLGARGGNRWMGICSHLGRVSPRCHTGHAGAHLYSDGISPFPPMLLCHLALSPKLHNVLGKKAPLLKTESWSASG